MAEAVAVGVRIRPFNSREKDLGATLCVRMQQRSTFLQNAEGHEHEFTYDESFWSHDGFEDDGTGYLKPDGPLSRYVDQQKVFDTFGARVLDSAFAGFHCCLFAYGQTGSGKSYSMVGYGQNKGIVPISCTEIFSRIAKDTDSENSYEVTLSMVEIYNETVQDLLIPVKKRPKKGLAIRESAILGVYIEGIHKRPVANYDSIHEVLQDGTNQRTVGATLMNTTSTRAHMVLLIEFKSIIKGLTRLSMMNLVDLAGSEKTGQTGAEGLRFKEGAMINKSLSTLGLVIEKLASAEESKQSVIVPYRDSKLTRLLQNALGGSSKTIMICAISPASSNYEDTLSTLRYAERAKRIKTHAVVNENPQDKLMRELQEENAKLKASLCDLQSGQGICLDTIRNLGQRQEHIREVESALEELKKTFDQRLEEAQEKQEEAKRDRRRRTAMSLDEDMPVLVNLNADLQLTGRIRHGLREGPTTIGDSSSSSGSSSESGDSENTEFDAPDIELMSEDMHSNHATVVNNGGRCVITSSEEAAVHTCLNGVSFEQLLQMQNSPHQREGNGFVLEHGDRIIFGRCYFVFIEPSISLPEVVLASGEVSYDMAVMEEKQNARRSTFKTLRSSFCSADQMFAGIGEPVTLKEIKAEHAEELRRKDEQLKAKDEEIAALRIQLDTSGYGEVRTSEAIAEEIRHGKYEAAAKVLDSTFQEAFAQLTLVEKLLATV
eukprot:TRINITY_DN10284_c0_g1_i1.p1 TRINITY_DN10284_c0_g1~~TRINITY_DN10284_c0_g1_i1.p1  ORF type:complete len:726 (+),score=140.11 TRINITY_DN10284_c0_g1_i1:28-2178(+)